MNNGDDLGGVVVKIKRDYAQERKIEVRLSKALGSGMEGVLRRILREKVIPHETGRMEAETRIDDRHLDKGIIRLVSDVHYAVFVYHKPDQVFTPTPNWNARCFWFEPFLTGRLKGVFLEDFLDAMR